MHKTVDVDNDGARNSNLDQLISELVHILTAYIASLPSMSWEMRINDAGEVPRASSLSIVVQD